MWPLIYGENSKQLDDYIHRIYCRDCQKSQEQRPLGDRGDSDRQTSKNSIRVHSEVNKCQLQHLKDVNEANICKLQTLRDDTILICFAKFGFINIISVN